ncbi:uncharacterized protein ARMOST_21639 [Armillaria ostoyae]|uniref:Uncharacterized protein n=1 Tax=Armillaria ostoyae TaxID=47428 RepID=A0A284SAL5_ARMOS|nr:uncharacterized protein ARMOST_21639 [Armillaria ostoyae]
MHLSSAALSMFACVRNLYFAFRHLSMATRAALLCTPTTIPFNIEGVDGGNMLVDHEVTADYVQGMFAGVQGGSHNSVSFHLFKTQYQYEVFSVFGPASDDNE